MDKYTFSEPMKFRIDLERKWDAENIIPNSESYLVYLNDKCVYRTKFYNEAKEIIYQIKVGLFAPHIETIYEETSIDLIGKKVKMIEHAGVEWVGYDSTKTAYIVGLDKDGFYDVSYNKFDNEGWKADIKELEFID